MLKNKWYIVQTMLDFNDGHNVYFFTLMMYRLMLLTTYCNGSAVVCTGTGWISEYILKLFNGVQKI